MLGLVIWVTHQPINSNTLHNNKPIYTIKDHRQDHTCLLLRLCMVHHGCRSHHIMVAIHLPEEFTSLIINHQLTVEDTRHPFISQRVLIILPDIRTSVLDATILLKKLFIIINILRKVRRTSILNKNIKTIIAANH